MERIVARDVLDQFERSDSGLATWLRYLLDRAKPLAIRESLARGIRQRRYPIADPAPWAAAHWGLVDPREAHPRAYVLADRSFAHLAQVPAGRRSFELRHLRHQVLNPALLDVFAGEAWGRLAATPVEALGWLDLARVVLVRLQAAKFPAYLLMPFRLRLDAHRANAYRVLGHLLASEQIFQSFAAMPWQSQVPRIEIEAEILSLEASLRVDQHAFDRAAFLHSRAERLCRELEDHVGLAKILMKVGVAAEYAGESDRALVAHDQAALYLERIGDPALCCGVSQNRADSLISLGRLDEASKLLASILGQSEELSSRHPILRLRYCWIEAKLAEAAGRLEESEQRLVEVQRGMASSGRTLAAALATLQAAEVSLMQRDWSEAASRAESVQPVFSRQGRQTEAVRAARLFQQAVAAQV